MAAAKTFEALTKDREAMDSTGFSLAQPFRVLTGRCQRRFVDYQRLVMDVQNSALTNGSKAAMQPSAVRLLMKERWSLFVMCTESKAGQEPANPYLYSRYN